MTDRRLTGTRLGGARLRGTQLPSQGPVGADGLLLHEGDYVAQLALALENLEQALTDAGLAATDLVELRIHTTDRRMFDDASEVLTDRLAEHGISPLVTVTEVSRLEQPGMTVTVQPVTARPITTRPITTHQGETSMTVDFTRTSCPIQLPGDAGYDQARTPWAVHVDQRPAAVAVPRSAAEVVEAVRAALDAGLRIAPQSSGHGASPFVAADLSDVMLIRLHELTGVTIDADRRIARVLGGTLWQPVVEAAAAYGLAALHGSSADVAVAGYTLGGGLSWYSREHGLAAHHLTAVEIVLADGRLVRVDADHQPDLFWALKGGGGSFGIVTALEFGLLPIADVCAGMLLWPGERAAEVVNAWAAWTRTVPDSMSTSCRLMNFPPLPELPPFLSGRTVVVVDGAVLESDERAAELLAPLRALAPELDTFARIPLPALTRIHLDPEGPTPSATSSIMLGEIEPETVDALLAAAGPGSGSSLLVAELRHLGGALARPADAAVAALPGNYLGFFLGIAPFPEAAAIGLADATRAAEALTPWGTGGRYLNFDDNVVEVSAAYEPGAWQRLQQIRAEVDPQRRMVANHGI